MTPLIRVLIADDSPVCRYYLRHILETDGDIMVVGIAVNGEEAVRFAERLKPGLIVMDINMPKMNGYDATRRIMETNPVPIIIVSASYDTTDVKMTFHAMEAGAIAFVNKPSGEGHPDHDESLKDFVNTVKLMSEVKVVKRWPKTSISEAVRRPIPEFRYKRIPKKIKLVAIGASTGGPPVLQTILSGLQGGFPVPVLIVQHIAKGFLKGMVEWLQHTTILPILIATDGEHILPGHIYFAPEDFNMGVDSAGKVAINRTELENGVRPSVSYLFHSAVNVFGGDLVGILLTGMGRDGAEELRFMKDRGGITIVQNKESSVVYGMPWEAVKLNAATYELSPEMIAQALEILVDRNYINTNSRIENEILKKPS